MKTFRQYLLEAKLGEFSPAIRVASQLYLGRRHSKPGYRSIEQHGEILERIPENHHKTIDSAQDPSEHLGWYHHPTKTFHKDIVFDPGRKVLGGAIVKEGKHKGKIHAVSFNVVHPDFKKAEGYTPDKGEDVSDHILHESFDKPYPFAFRKTIHHDVLGRIHQYHFATPNGSKFRVNFMPGDHNPDHHKIVSFAQHYDEGDYRHSTTDITGKQGHSSGRILSTVKAVIQHHIKANPHIQMISFSAKEPSRQKLYNHIARSSGYEHKIAKDFDGETRIGIKVRK